MVKYETIKETFENGGCKLLTTDDEMVSNNLGTTSKYSIIGACGHHIENCWYHMFKYRGTGKYCKDCNNKHFSKVCKNILFNLCIMYGSSLLYVIT